MLLIVYSCKSLRKWAEHCTDIWLIVLDQLIDAHGNAANKGKITKQKVLGILTNLKKLIICAFSLQSLIITIKILLTFRKKYIMFINSLCKFDKCVLNQTFFGSDPMGCFQ